jgi:phage terminase large subunit GpA-like protein
MQCPVCGQLVELDGDAGVDYGSRPIAVPLEGVSVLCQSCFEIVHTVCMNGEVCAACAIPTPPYEQLPAGFIS